MMRKIFLALLMMTTLSLSMSGQKNYLPMLEEGRVWNMALLNTEKPGESSEGNYQDIHGDWYNGSTFSLSIQGNTTYYGHVYMRLVDDNGHFVCALRQEGGKIYSVWGSSSEYVIIDFSLNEGDVFPARDSYQKELKVLKVDTICVNGENRKRLKIVPNDDNFIQRYADYWVEGIGCSGGPYYPAWYNVIGNHPLLLSCCQDGDTIFEKSDFNVPGINKMQEDDIFQVGRKWIVINSFYTPSKVYSLIGYKCEGQEVVDGLLCNVLSDYSMSDFENPFEVDDDVLFSEDNKRSTSYIFQNGSKYYLHIPDEGWVDELLYDFSLNKGDSILLYPLDPNTVVIGDLSSLVTEVGDTVLEESSDKRVRKWLRIDEFAEGGGFNDTWIEGIGSLRGGPLGSRFSYTGGHVLYKCFDDANIYYINKDIPWQKDFASSIPFVEQNKEWNVRWRMITGAPYDYTHLYSMNYYISGDTIINGKEYCKMYCNDQYRGKKRQYVLALYEDAGKVFFIPRGKDEEHLLYDFSANAGDWVRARGFSTTWGGSDFEFLVWKREEKEFQGEKRRCLWVVPNTDYYPIPEDVDDKWAEDWGEWWIEGIGTEKSPIEHYLPDFVGSIDYLEYCKDGEGLLYQRDYTPPICLVEENMSWIVEYADADRDPEDTRLEKLHYFFDPSSRGDLDGCFSRLLSVSALGDEENAHIVADMREEGGKVYICPWKRAPLSFLLYDFSANVGDEMEITGVPALNRYEDVETIPELYSAKCRIEKVEELEIEGVRRRCLYVQEVLPYEDFKDSPTYDDVWIEGIGSVRGILGNVSFEMDGKSPYTKLQECSWSGEVYYQADDHPGFASSRPFIEEDKVWKVGTISGNPVQVVDYYYFDGDTIIDGKTCKQMMCQRHVSPDYSNEYWTPTSALSKVGAWYEENQKVYFYDEIRHSMEMKYDFSLNAYDTLQINDDLYVIGPKQMGGIKGFKGVYRDIMVWVTGNSNYSTTWLESVGGIMGPRINAYNPILSDPIPEFLMSCTVGDEVIYLNDSYEDGVSPDANVPKRRIDFTHTVKVKPKAPVRKNTDETEEDPLVGEYSDRLLNIDLGKLSNDYSMVIKNQSDSVVYVKSVRANEIVALNIDISDYDGGDYTINIENSDEVFSGVFSIDPTAIHEIASESKESGQRMKEVVYDLTGRPVSKDRLTKGIYIQNGKKVLVR